MGNDILTYDGKGAWGKEGWEPLPQKNNCEFCVYSSFVVSTEYFV